MSIANDSIRPYVLHLQRKTQWETGLTKREHFACEAMKIAMVSDHVWNREETILRVSEKEAARQIAFFCVAVADALIERLEKEWPNQEVL